MGGGGGNRPRDRYGLPSLRDGGCEPAIFPGAKCHGSGLNFFPTKLAYVRGSAGRVPIVDESPEKVRPLRELCRRCEWITECAELALHGGETAGGVWGGLTEKDRKELRRKERIGCAITTRCPKCGGVNTWKQRGSLWHCGHCDHRW